MKFPVQLVWNSKTRDPFARTTATLWVKCKKAQLKAAAERLAETYGAHSYVI